MSDPHRPAQPSDGEDLATLLVRASIPGRPSGLHPTSARALSLFAPGRTRLEAAVLFAALAILAPWASVAAVAFALAARRAGNRRWLAALAAAVWCGVLGLAVRVATGLGFFP